MGCGGGGLPRYGPAPSRDRSRPAWRMLAVGTVLGCDQRAVGLRAWRPSGAVRDAADDPWGWRVNAGRGFACWRSSVRRNRATVDADDVPGVDVQGLSQHRDADASDASQRVQRLGRRQHRPDRRTSHRLSSTPKGWSRRCCRRPRNARGTSRAVIAARATDELLAGGSRRRWPWTLSQETPGTM